MNMIDKFIENWKVKATEYYMEAFNEYLEMKVKFREAKKLYSDKYGDIYIHVNQMNEDQRKAKLASEEIKEDFMKYRTASELAILDKMAYGAHKGSNTTTEKELDTVLTREANKKKAQLIARVEKKIGKIVDGTALYFGVDGSINGVVKGELDVATLTTIYAGGYNVQCLHYRVLIK